MHIDTSEWRVWPCGVFLQSNQNDESRAPDVQVQKRDFPEGSQGFWLMLYADESMRIFISNQRNYFVLHNKKAGQTVYSEWKRFDKKGFT
jgi:hypothetical protein